MENFRLNYLYKNFHFIINYRLTLVFRRDSFKQNMRKTTNKKETKMKRIKVVAKVIKGFKFGVYNHKEKYVESHHRTAHAATRQATSRAATWCGRVAFEVVEILN